jgi:exoribonuclease-2
LAALKRKRTNQGAFDLLVQIGAWKKHEDIALLRSGFPTRFTSEELAASKEALGNNHDPDHLLGIRKDLRHLKVYTIDDQSTYEIDDGISIEKIRRPDGSEGMKIWIHISDADR